jgi:peroxiredoxin (alkyl hydroperoxide reductase subunit C)
MGWIGKTAPAWCASAYSNGEEVAIGSSDYRGRWHVLYWYPLDFTFVCPTEIRGFQSLLGDFRANGIEVVGASTDSFFSHQQWFADRKTFPEEITHPVIADRAFDVLKEDQGVAYRATVIVDDRGVIRSVAINDLSVGRSPSEVLRTAQALQSGGLCGADWKRGDAFVG